MDWLTTGYAPSSPTMGVSHWRGQDSVVVQSIKAGRLHSPSLTLEAWKIPGELLGVSLWNHREVGSGIGEGMPKPWDAWTRQ